VGASHLSEWCTYKLNNHTDGEVTANRPDIIIKTKDIHVDRCDNTNKQKCHAKGSRKETKIQKFMLRDTTNVKHEINDYTVNNCSHRSSNKSCKEKSASHTRKTFNRLTTQDSSTWNITHNTGNTAVWNWKSERWGSQLVQLERYLEEKGCNKRRSGGGGGGGGGSSSSSSKSHAKL
jgi:hypothetical protein